MVLTVSFVLFPVTGLYCHRRLADRSANLMPASGHQNHTTSPSARHVRSSFAPPLVHRIPCPTSVTIAKRPSVGRDGVLIILIWVNREQEYFCERGWTTEIKQATRFACRANRELPIGLIKMHLKRRRVNEAVININLNEEFAWLSEFAVGRCF